MFFVPSLFEENGRDLVFAFPWVLPPPIEVGTLWVQLHLQFYTNSCFESSLHILIPTSVQYIIQSGLAITICIKPYIFCLLFSYQSLLTSAKDLLMHHHFFCTLASLHLQFFAKKKFDLLHNCHNCLQLIQCFSADLILPYHSRHHTVHFPTGLR